MITKPTTTLVYSVQNIVANPCVFARYKVVVDSRLIKTVREEIPNNIIRRLFGSSRTRIVSHTEPDDCAHITNDTINVHPHYAQEVKRALEQYVRKADAEL
ncbi:hypothetical protein YOLOSWAG_193 [Erwinia phage vB_EamM_Yoloswag]|uniref:Uncharacterized protein n=1 Tax=Erwinia phage vB_EamM_Yoloswag TaxID=1958956 RepID=A0A1S6L3B7_9CAUD|nr:hypothetical protein HOR66_gp193 [Erwinia phage vB_EamM_Yoloswag]AQT28672.1 hypothetical protein YOLOSWAG_193 [Erwinia phage vB_EamM_Yoloswag]